MRYGNLDYLYLLFVIPLLVIWFVVAAKRRKGALEKFAQEGTLSRIVRSTSKRKRLTKIVLIIAGCIFLIFALIEPKWGYHIENVTRRGIDIVIAIDTSRSMLADDIKPNRLAAAKRKVEDLLKIIDGDRIGLVAFAGTAFTYCPLTTDYGAFRLFLHDLDTSVIPLGGTDLAIAIKKSIQSFNNKVKNHKTIILITDGEDHSEGSIEAAKEAKENGIIIYTIGMGKKEGAYIRIKDENGIERLLKDKNGQVIKSRLNEIILNKIALETGGAYAPAYGTEWGLERIYTEEIARIEEKELGSERIKRFENRYQIPLLVALVLITLESLIGTRRKDVTI
ncbi:MAG: VWA domain-containing protein [Candidatus Anammoxibacter sp.]